MYQLSNFREIKPGPGVSLTSYKKASLRAVAAKEAYIPSW